MAIIEKIMELHPQKKHVIPGDIVDISIDTSIPQAFGETNIVKIIEENNLCVVNLSGTYFKFDCSLTDSNQMYPVNQQICRIFARKHSIKIYNSNKGIGLYIEEGLTIPGSTSPSTDSHANPLGTIRSFGQRMGDRDIASVWSTGKTWFKVPETIKLNLKGKIPLKITAI